MESSQSDDWDMYLIVGHRYRFMLMWGTIIEATITGYGDIYEETFYCKPLTPRARVKQFYYHDIDYAQDITNDN